MVCPNCKTTNDSNNKFCSLCGIDLNSEYKTTETSIVESDTSDNNEFFGVPKKSVKILGLAVNIIVIIPFFLVGIVFFSIGLYNTILEKSKVKDFSKATGYLKEITDCEEEYDEDDYYVHCVGVYEYEVEGVKYTISSKELTEPKDITQSIRIYYDPKKPSKSHILGDWIGYIIFGSIFLVIALITLAIRQTILHFIINSNNKMV